MNPTSMHLRVLLPVMAVAVFSACTDLSEYDRERVRDAMADSLLSVTESRNIRMELIEDGQRIVSVSAPFAATFSREGRSETDLRDSVYVAVLDSTGAVETEVTSRSARYLGHQSEFHFSDEVFVRTRDGRRLSTDYLEWSQTDRTIYTPDFVIIVTEADSITGYGLTGTDDLTSYRLTEVTGEFELEQNRQE
jgi:LPS export ABC transporter protein LptC